MSGLAVRFAALEDAPALIAFIRDHWSARHVFVRDPEVFAWQYAQADGRLNMVLAEREDEDGSRTILGVLGFIPLGRFDPQLGDGDILLALWKVRDDIAPPGLGLRFLKLIQAQLKPRMIGAIGISEMVKPIYRALGYTVGGLQQAALFNPAHRGRCVVAQGVPDSAFEAGPTAPGAIRLHGVDEAAAPEIAAAIDRIAEAGSPRKSWDYVRERYLRHPWYRYSLRAVERNGAIEALAVWRAVECNGARILRIVDVVGPTDWLAGAAPLLREALAEADAEYIDIMQVGTSAGILKAGGFLSPADHPALVLPNYFAPFEARNIDIALAYRTFGPDATAPRLYRADSDQDRPN